MGYIYKIINDINGKIYIGKTEQFNPNHRWKEHLREYKKERCEKRPIYEAMKKYGVEHFHFEVIEETDNSEEREKYWINELRTYIGFDDCNGYNATLGGDGKKFKKYKMDIIINLYKQGYNCSEISKIINLDRTYVALLLKNNGIKVAKTTDMYSKQVCQIDVVTNELIHVFNSITEASKSIQNANRSGIQRAANTMMQKLYCGYKWIFYTDYIKLQQ